jgi:uncharacterized protein YyaL (SSP411 family)
VGLLDDQAWMMRALNHAYAATTNERYLSAARAAASYVLANLVDDDGGLLSAPRVMGQAPVPSAGETKDANQEIGVPRKTPIPPDPSVVSPRRDLDDSPSQSAATVAAEALADLAWLTGEDRYREVAERALAASAAAVRGEWGLALAGYGLAVDHVTAGPRTVVVVGPTADEHMTELVAAARRAYVPAGLMLALDPAQAGQQALLKRLGYPVQGRIVAYICRHGSCLPPVTDPTELAELLSRIK